MRRRGDAEETEEEEKEGRGGDGGAIVREKERHG